MANPGDLDTSFAGNGKKAIAFASTDLGRQKAKLLATLILLRKSFRDLDAIVPKLRELGERHGACRPLPGGGRDPDRVDGRAGR